MLASLCAAPARITYETRAVPLVRVLDELSPKLGRDLRCEGPLRSAPIVVSVTDVESADLLAKIAEVVGAEWHKENNYELLAQTPAQKRREEQASLAAQVDLVRRAIAPAARDLQPKFEAGDAEGLFNTLSTLSTRLAEDRGNIGLHQAYEAQKLRGPLNRALIRLVLTIPFEEIARAGERTVFTLKPTPRQRPFGPGADKILAELVAEQTLWSDTLARLDPDSRKRGESVGEPFSQRSPAIATGNLRVILSRRIPGTLLFNLVMDGDPLAAGWPRTQWRARPPELDRTYDTLQAVRPAGGQAIALSPLSRALADQFRSFGGGSRMPLSAELKEWLTDPVLHEPLELLPSECLQALAAERGKPLVAWVPDAQLLLLASAAVQGPISLETYEQIVSADLGGMKIREEAGWVLAAPIDPAGARREFTDRKAMKQFAQSIDAKGRVRLLDFARYAASITSSRYENLGLLSMMFLDPAASSVLDQTDWAALKIYGSLSDLQLRDLANGGGLRVDRTTPAQRGFLEEYAFGSGINRARVLTPNSFRTEGTELEPTVVLAGGLPLDSVLTLAVASSPAIFAFTEMGGKGSVSFRTIDAGTIAYLERRSGTGLDLSGPPISGYGMGELTMIRLKLAYGPGAWHEAAMTENGIDKSEKPRPWSELPAAIADAIRAALKREPPPRIED